ncbi:MAG: hypothetical protein K8U03_14645 [Planctomycetia bacterium]|nr:hypothetical protein [Planctomycetia bacterium]
MSTLDQAFIRAYQAGRSTPAAQPTGAAVDAAPRPSSHPSVATAAPELATAAATASPARSARSRHYVDSAHGSTAAPHFRATTSPQPSAPAQAPIERRAGYDSDAYAEATLAQETTSTLEGNPYESGRRESAVVEEIAVPFCPAFETERFHWPRNVEVLIAATGNEFAQFTAELEERIGAGRQTLVVTGIGRSEGRSTLVLALARLLANRNLRAVVVDADLRQPQLAELLGIRPELGWDDVYAERLSLTDALIESLADRVTLLPMRSGFSNPRALAGNKTFAGIIEQLKQNYDAVILDVGPLPDDQDTIDLAAALTGCKLDDAIVVRDRRTTSPKDVQAVCRRLAVLGVHHCDIAENFTELQGY